mgnify:FL=1
MSDSKAQDLINTPDTDTDFSQPKTAAGPGTYRGEEVVTSCAACCFANYEGKTQVGCELGRIEKFQEKGTKVVEAEDGEREFYLVHRMCNCYREGDWAEYWKHKKKRVLKENAVRVNFIVPINDGDTIEDLQKTLVSIATQDDFEAIKVITMNNSKHDNFDIIHKLHEIFGSYAEQTSYLNKSEEGTTFVGGIMVEKNQDFWTVLEAAFDYATNGFYTIVDAGSVVAPDLLKKINNAINIELNQILMIEPHDKDSYSGLTVSCALHKYLSGSKDTTNFEISKPIYDKVKKIAQTQDFERLIVKWEDLG